MLLLLILALFLVRCISQYNHQSSSLLKPDWLSKLDNGIPLRKLSLLGSHSSMSTGVWGDAFQTQGSSLNTQLMMGMRAIDIRCRHFNNGFSIHDRLVYLNIELDGVLLILQTFLASYPMQAVVMHIVEQYSASGNSRSFEDTFISYKNSFPNLIWKPTSQTPVLGEVRGKVVILQDFSGKSVHGLLYTTFTVMPHKWFNTNWDQYSKWMEVKAFIGATATAGESRVGFWTGHGGSFPYFVASGKSSPGNSASLLATGLTTPGFSSSYPDFPRVACFIGICTIAFQGINNLAYSYINSNSISYLGIVFTDFIGDVVLQKAISMNAGKFVPCPSSQLSQGCTYCTATGVCLGCNTTNNYIFNTASSSCLAAAGYYLQSINATANQPVTCNSSMLGCMECTSATACTKCDILANYRLSASSCVAAYRYYLNATGYPQVCTLVGCFQCASATVCTTCSSVQNFIMDNSTQTCVCDTASNFTASPSGNACICLPGFYLTSNNTCGTVPLCPDTGSGCLNCTISSTNSCALCDAPGSFQTAVFDANYCECTNGFYFTGSGCSACSSSLTAACLSCASSALCLSCQANFTIFQGQCICLNQYYLSSPSTCDSCPIGCLRCTSATVCTICDAISNFTMTGTMCDCISGTFLNESQCVPCGAMAGCLACNSAGCTSCDSIIGFTLNVTTAECQCNYGFFINDMDICEACTSLGCVNCLSNTVCVECNVALFYLQTGVCKDICGDGKLYSVECDDGNMNDGDGCSSSCVVQKDYTCVGGTEVSPSLCSYSGPVIINVQSYIKDPLKNSVYLTTSISPNLPEFSALNFTQVMTPKFTVTSTYSSYDSSNGILSMTFEYGQSLNTEQLQLQFVPPAVPAYFYIPRVSKVLPYTTDNNLALKPYSSEQYELLNTVELLTIVLAFSAAGVFLISFVVVSKLMAVEMLLIYQLAYSSLIMLQKLQLFMNPLRNLWLVNGYNNLFKDNPSGSVPGRISEVYYKSSFLANFSIDLILVVLPILIGGLWLLVSKLRNNKESRLTAYKILKEWLLSALLFAQMHLDVSIFLGVSYSADSIMGLIIGGVLSVLLVVELVLLFKSPKNFGEYTDFFGLKAGDKAWYIVVVIYRVIIATLIGILGQHNLAIFGALGLSVLYLVSLLIRKPYVENGRPIINSIFVCCLLAGYTVSKCFQDSEEVQVYTSYLPLLIIGILFLALICNAACMLVHLIKGCRKGKVNKDQEILNENQTEQRELQKIYINEMKQNLKDYLIVGANVDFGDQRQNSPRMSKLKIQDLIISKMAIKMQQPLELQASGRIRSDSDSDDNLQQFAL